MRNYLKVRHQGATMIEFVILLPLFLFTVLFFIWYATILNAQTSLMSAVTNGVRLASTRGRGEVYGKFDISAQHFEGAIPEIDRAHDQFDPVTGAYAVGVGDLPTREHLLIEGAPIDPMNPYAGYKITPPNNPTGFTTNFGEASLFALPYPEYSYAIAYAAQSMRMSVGGTIRYPCNPHDVNGEGCLLCRPIHPIKMHDAPLTIDDKKLLAKRIAIRCDYRPSSFVVGPMLRILSILSGGVLGDAGGMAVISRAAYSDRYQQCRQVPECTGGPPPTCTMKICCDDDECV